MHRQQASKELLELLVDRATEGLAEVRAFRLRQLLGEAPGADDSSLDLAAAALHLSWLTPAEEPPEGLDRQLRRRARVFVARESGAAPGAPEEIE